LEKVLLDPATLPERQPLAQPQLPATTHADLLQTLAQVVEVGIVTRLELVILMMLTKTSSLSSIRELGVPL
jgi:hypothetical protein